MTEDKVLEISLKLSEIVNKTGYQQYHKSKLPNDIDNEIVEICEFIKNIDNEQIKQFVDLLDEQSMWTMLTFSTRMSMLGVRNNSTEDLLNGLIALVVNTKYDNYQSVLGRISLFYHSAFKIKAEPRTLFTTAINYATSDYARNLFLQFLDRAPSDQRIEAFGAKEIQGSKGLIYQFGNRPIPEGWL
jgi:hypothetical protein